MEKRFFWTIWLQHFALGTLISSFYLYLVKLEITLTDLAFLTMIISILSLIFEPITSFLADFCGHKKVLILGYFCLIISFLALVTLPNFKGIAINQIFLSLGLCCLSGTEESFLYEITENPDNFKKSNSNFNQKLALM